MVHSATSAFGPTQLEKVAENVVPHVVEREVPADIVVGVTVIVLADVVRILREQNARVGVQIELSEAGIRDLVARAWL